MSEDRAEINSCKTDIIDLTTDVREDYDSLVFSTALFELLIDHIMEDNELQTRREAFNFFMRDCRELERRDEERRQA